ncbi:MAG: histidine phosphatase family protein [Alphaproteobacteria bacterium]|nr:histidine phosphatase family protein [Alphaproteobacteria bacterium]
MPLLHVLRHAKSSWNEAIADRERPLNRRGRETARLVGRHLAAATGPLDLALCSTALRTRETLELVLAGSAPRPRIALEDGIYLASGAHLLARLRALAETDDNVLLIGHNPGLHELAVKLADPESPEFAALTNGKFPTAARASFRIAPSWSAIDRSRHELIAYVTPKSLGGES